MPILYQKSYKHRLELLLSSQLLVQLEGAQSQRFQTSLLRKLLRVLILLASFDALQVVPSLLLFGLIAVCFVLFLGLYPLNGLLAALQGALSGLLRALSSERGLLFLPFLLLFSLL